MRKILNVLTVTLLTAVAGLSQTTTPNIGLTIPATHSQNWQVPMDTDFNILDGVFGGLTAVPQLVLSGPIINSNQAATKAYVDAHAGGSNITYPGMGIVVSTGSAWGTSLVAPSSGLVGLTDTQTLINKTVNGVIPTVFGYIDVTSSIQTQLNGKAPLASPALTGTPTAPTAATGTSSTQLATTAFVQNTLGALLCDAIGNCPATDRGNTFSALQTFSAGIQGGTGTFSFGGAPGTMTAAGSQPYIFFDSSNSNLLTEVNTNGVKTVLGSGTGSGGGMIYPAAGVAVSTGSAWASSLTAPSSALVGVSDTQSLINKTIDSVSPTTFTYLDATSSIQGQLNGKAPLASPALTGTPTAPTPATNDNSTKVATTAFVVSSQVLFAANNVALPTSSIAANTCVVVTGSPFAASAVTLASEASFGWAGGVNPTTIAGYGATGGLSVRVYIPAAGQVSLSICNPNSAAIIPGAASINIRVRP